MRIYRFIITAALLAACVTENLHAQVVSTDLTEQLSGGHWKNLVKDTGFIYNSECQELYHLNKMWDSTTWLNHSQANRSYYSSGKFYQDSETVWDTPNPGWNNSLLVTDTYDGSNYLINQSLKTWDVAGSVWKNYYQTSYTNNSDGTAHLGYNLVWSGGVWDTNTVQTYIYNTPGTLDTLVTVALVSPGVYQNSQRLCYINVSGNRTGQVSQYWSTDWQNQQLQNYIPHWHMLDSEKISNWNTATNSWDTMQRVTFTYTPCAPASVTQINAADPILVYPNPASGYFTVSGLVQGQVIELYNYTGQRIESRIADNAAAGFNIASYANGMYLVRIQNKDGSVATQRKIVKTNEK